MVVQVTTSPSILDAPTFQIHVNQTIPHKDKNTPNDHFHQILTIKQTIGDYLNTNICLNTIAKRMANRSKFIMNNPPNNIG